MKRIIFVLGLMFFLSACSDTLDLGGLITSEEEVNARFTQSQEWNYSHLPVNISASSNEYEINFAGDVHVGGIHNLQTLLSMSKSPWITALFLAGDNTSGHKEDYDVLKQVLDTVSDVNYKLLAGNHDLYFDGWPIYHAYFGTSSYTVDINTPDYSDLYIMLDNASGTIGSLQLEWLKTVLREQRSLHRYCFVVLHCNFFRNRFTISTNPVEEEIYTLTDLFAQYNVNMVVTGHDHERYIEVFGKTTYITMDALQDGETNAGWMKVSVGNDSLTYMFYQCM